MHQDIWGEVIQFLEPIDLLTSLLTLNRNVYEFICQAACLEFEDICKFCDGDANLLGGVRISFHHRGDIHTEDIISMNNDRVTVIGNTKFIVRLYLLKLAKRLGNIYPDVKFEKEIATILDSYELELLNFYRTMLFPQFKYQESGIILSYLLIGDAAIGKTTLNCWIASGRKRMQRGMPGGLDFSPKSFQIANEIVCHHQIWDTAIQERFFNRDGLVTQFARHIKTGYLLCFSMLHRETFKGLEEWFAIHELKSSNIGIIAGLHPQKNPIYYEQTKVSVKDAVMKSYSLGKSVFVESDCVEEKQIYACFWFLQLQYSYFHNFKETSNKPHESTTNSTNSWCSLL